MSWFSTAWDTYILHPLRGNGYQWWSGPGSDIGEAGIIVGLLAMLRKHNCHERRCWRMSFHTDPQTGRSTCRRHHPDHPKGQK